MIIPDYDVFVKEVERPSLWKITITNFDNYNTSMWSLNETLSLIKAKELCKHRDGKITFYIENGNSPVDVNFLVKSALKFHYLRTR